MSKSSSSRVAAEVMASKLLTQKPAQMDDIRRKKILLADDEPGVREAMKLMLSIDQHTVVEAANGTEALELFSPEAYDLVITDYSMPGEMQGDKLVENIKSVSPSQPIILATGHAEKFKPSGKPADAVIGKPFAFTDLRDLMARLLAKDPSQAEA